MTKEEKKKHKREESPRYHTPVDTKLKLYDDGWTTEGREYYNTLIGKFQFLKSNEQLWINMNNHWMVYENEVLGTKISVRWYWGLRIMTRNYLW